MLEWISQHQKILSLVINFGTLLIWLVYAQLLYLGFRRQRRPRLIINRGKNKNINALCIISNMSVESIFIEYIVATLETSRGDIIMDITDFEQSYSEDDEQGGGEQKGGEQESRKSRRVLSESPVNENTRQGPLGSGEFVHIGTFHDLIRRMLRQQGIGMEHYRPKGDLQLHKLTIRLIGIYGPEDLPIGAERSFDLEDDGNDYSLTPATWDTKRMASMRMRRKLRQQIQELNSTNFEASTIKWKEEEAEEEKVREGAR